MPSRTLRLLSGAIRPLHGQLTYVQPEDFSRNRRVFFGFTGLTLAGLSFLQFLFLDIFMGGGGATWPELGICLIVTALHLIAARITGLPNVHGTKRLARLFVALTSTLAALLILAMLLLQALPGLEIFLFLVLITVVVTLVTWVGLAFSDYGMALRVRQRALAAQQEHAASAIRALQNEETRVKALISEGLHGSVQQSLILLERRLTALLETQGTHDNVREELRSVSKDLADVREHEVRGLAQLIRPAGIDLGAVQAVQLLMHRIPPSIQTRIEIADDVFALEAGGADLELGTRLVIVAVVQEALSNALKHGQASSVHLRMRLDDAARRVLLIHFDDDGVGVPVAAQFSGLDRLTTRLRGIGGDLRLGPSPTLGGTRLSATVPV